MHQPDPQSRRGGRAVPIALSIAGSDSSGGAGIQADLKTFWAFGVYGATVLTSVTAQNTVGIRAAHDIPPDVIASQLDAVFDDLEISAVKIGMVSRTATVAAIADRLAHHRPPFIVLDPVMISTSGSRLLATDAVDALKSRLMPLVDCLTPNLAEAAALLGTRQAASEAEMVDQGRALLDLGPRAVLMKGGHAPLSEAVDLLVTSDGRRRYAAPWVDTRNLHGTGCTLSSAMTASLALGDSLEQAIDRSKAYLTAAIAAARGLEIGHGCGPLSHPPGICC
jgi:hydroxymethylpyrimidine/phosphomethylpyrimidine kinase